MTDNAVTDNAVTGNGSWLITGVTIPGGEERTSILLAAIPSWPSGPGLITPAPEPSTPAA